MKGKDSESGHPDLPLRNFTPPQCARIAYTSLEKIPKLRMAGNKVFMGESFLRFEPGAEAGWRQQGGGQFEIKTRGKKKGPDDESGPFGWRNVTLG